MNEFSQICREENQALHEASLKKYVRARRIKTFGEIIGTLICILSLYAFTVLMFCL